MGGRLRRVWLDYLVLVPARRRACTRTGVALDATYPDYIASTSDTNKLIRHDLSGLVASGSGAFGPDAGMGGSTLEPTHQPRPEIGTLGGAFDLLVWPSSVVPDDPGRVVDRHGDQPHQRDRQGVRAAAPLPGALMKQTTISVQDLSGRGRRSALDSFAASSRRTSS